jgi:hypothetical protein
MRFFIRVWRALMCDIRNKTKQKKKVENPPTQLVPVKRKKKSFLDTDGNEKVMRRVVLQTFSFSFFFYVTTPPCTRLDRQEYRECVSTKPF